MKSAVFPGRRAAMVSIAVAGRSPVKRWLLTKKAGTATCSFSWILFRARYARVRVYACCARERLTNN